MPEQIVVPNEELRIEIIDNKKAENFADVNQTQLYFMDVLKFLDSLPKEPIFDLVVTSPPYNIGKEYETTGNHRYIWSKVRFFTVIRRRRWL